MSGVFTGKKKFAEMGTQVFFRWPPSGYQWNGNSTTKWPTIGGTLWPSVVIEARFFCAKFNRLLFGVD
jgi:hypothetical protein